MTILRRAFERRGATGAWGDTSPPPPGGRNAGTVVRPSDALRVSTFMACCLAVSEDIAMLPLGSYREDRAGAVVPYRPTPGIVGDPFAEDDTRISSQTGRAQVVMSMLLRGNAYMQVVARTWQGTPAALVVLNPDKVTVRMVEGVLEYRVGNVVVPPADIVHILGPCLPGDAIGLSIVEMERVTFALAMGADEFASSWFERGVAPSGLLEIQRSLNKREAREQRDIFMSGHSGAGKAFGVAVVSGGTKYTPLSVTPEDAQFLATRQMVDERICGLVGVPPQRVGISAKGGNQGTDKGQEAQQINYLVHTLMRWSSRIEHAWSRMIPGGTTLARHDWTVLTRPDSATRWANALIARTIGVRTQNEIRLDEGYEPITGNDMDDPNAPLNSAHATQGSAGPADGANIIGANGSALSTQTRALLALTGSN